MVKGLICTYGLLLLAIKAACHLQSVVMQTIHDGFQHEQPDYWLNFGNPWEIERLNIAYTIKFYGHVSVQEEGGRQTFRWNPGESVSSCLLARARIDLGFLSVTLESTIHA